MATMIPEYQVDQIIDEHGSRAEAEVYLALQSQLPDSTTVLYSVPWIANSATGDIRDGEADFVIIDRERGLAVLEVKGGSIEIGSGGLWSTRDPAGNSVPVTNPFRQGVVSKNVFKREIKTIPGINVDAMVFAHGVALPDIYGDPGNLGTDAPKSIVLTGDNMSRTSEFVSHIFDYWDSDRSEPMDQEQVDLIVEKTFPTQILAPSLGAEVRDAENRILELTNQQRRILGTLRSINRACIEGAAGTGKTVLAFEKARHLADENLNTLLVCFNELLAERLNQRATSIPKLTVLTFHDLCIRLAKEADLDPGRPRGISNDEYFDGFLPDMLLSAIEKLTDRPFDAVIVDEGQDLDPEWWLHLESLLRNENEGCFWIFRDTAQNLYRRDPRLPEGMQVFPLDQNVRNTKNIHEAAAPFASGNPGFSTGVEGPEVRYELATNTRAVRSVIGRLLHELINEGGLSREDVIILTGASTKNSSISDLGRVGAFDLKLFGDAGTAVEVESIWRFKGLERIAVVIIDLAENADDPLRYVGMTRARSVLIIVGANNRQP